MIIVLGFFSSCEKEIPFNLDNENFNKKLAVDALIENGHVKLFLSQNRSVLSKDTVIAVENAIVYINNIKINENGNKYYPYTNVLAGVKPGDVLNFSVSKDGFPDITCQAIVPSKPCFKILSSKIVHSKGLLWYDEYIEFTIELSENKKDSADYFIIELIKTKYRFDYNYNATTGENDKTLKKHKAPAVFFTKDNIAEIIGSGLHFELNKDEFTLADDPVFPEAFIISDKTFDGKIKTLTFMTNNDFEYDFFEFKVSSINKGYYEFIQSVAAYNFNSGMFNEPIRIKSNINGGFGYFGIKTTVADSIKISDIN